jgi:aldose 1-epimerase
MKKIIEVLVLSLLFAACKKPAAQLTLSGLDALKFSGEVADKTNQLHVLKNANGMEVCVINFGARIVSITVPDKNGEPKDVVLGFDNLESYLNNPTDFGATIGRYGNRIAKGKFVLNETSYQLTINNGEHSLHGGITGFQYQMFDIAAVDSQTLECTYISPDGDNGYPGTLQMKVIYRLREDNALDISYEATTDKPTVVNLTNHSYFNLSGNPQRTITDHLLYLNADRFTPVDATLIPTGEIAEVKNTALDFTMPCEVGKRIDDDNPQILIGMGYDHNWIFRDSNIIDSVACELICPATGISMEVYTTEPAVQFYTGNFLNGTLTGKNNTVYQRRTGLCLETQHYPDSPNHPHFPSTTLNPGEKFTSRTVYKFKLTDKN